MGLISGGVNVTNYTFNNPEHTLMSQEETRPLTQNAESNSDPLDASSGMRHRPTAKVLTADSRYYTPPIEPQNEAERKEAADDRCVEGFMRGENQ